MSFHVIIFHLMKVFSQKKLSCISPSLSDGHYVESPLSPEVNALGKYPPYLHLPEARHTGDGGES